jgi:repressor LexA
MVAPLSPRQRDVLNAILRHQRHHDYAPTVRELCEAVGVSSPNTIAVHLDALERKRYIQRHDGLARSIEVLHTGGGHGPEDRGPKGMRILSLPIIGEIAAGLPIQANAQGDERYAIPFTMAGTEDAYILRVRGESMIDEHICSGDLVVVWPQPTARNGEIIVALLADNTVTLKKFYREGNHIRLQPANPTMPPIIIPAGEQCEIQGTVRTVIRQAA